MHQKCVRRQESTLWYTGLVLTASPAYGCIQSYLCGEGVCEVIGPDVCEEECETEDLEAIEEASRLGATYDSEKKKSARATWTVGW